MARSSTHRAPAIRARCVVATGAWAAVDSSRTIHASRNRGAGAEDVREVVGRVSDPAHGGEEPGVRRLLLQEAVGRSGP